MRRGRLAKARAETVTGSRRNRGGAGGGGGGRLTGWRDGHWVGGQLTALFRRELLIFLPLLLNLLALLRRQLLHSLVLLSRHTALIGGEARPRAHLFLDALLLRRWHRRIAFGDPQPFLFARGIQLVPFRGERGQDLFFPR